MTVPDAPPRHPLRFPDFRAYLVGRLCAVLAQYGMMIVLGWQAYNIARETMTTAGASAQLGLIGLAQFLPLFFLTPITGWVADHFDRRVITRITLSVLAAASGLLAFATYEGWVSLPLIFGMAVIVGTARAFNGPAYGALAPNLVPLAVLPNAIAISSVAWQAGMIAGPALGGYAYAATPWGAYAMAAGLFTVALGAMLLIGPVPQPPRQTGRHPIRQMIDGFAYVKGNRLVLATITLDLFAVLLAGAAAGLCPRHIACGIDGPGPSGGSAGHRRGGDGVVVFIPPDEKRGGVEDAGRGDPVRHRHHHIRVHRLPVARHRHARGPGFAGRAGRRGHGVGVRAPVAGAIAYARRDARARFEPVAADHFGV